MRNSTVSRRGTFARRNGRSMVDKLAGELLDAANRSSGAMRRREEGYTMAEANKAFSLGIDGRTE